MPSSKVDTSPLRNPFSNEAAKPPFFVGLATGVLPAAELAARLDVVLAAGLDVELAAGSSAGFGAGLAAGFAARFAAGLIASGTPNEAGGVGALPLGPAPCDKSKDSPESGESGPEADAKEEAVAKPEVTIAESGASAPEAAAACELSAPLTLERRATRREACVSTSILRDSAAAIIAPVSG
jgi:hypothetical protein